jgi:hypothetical protein
LAGIRNAGGFTISLITPSIAFNKICYGTRYRYNKIYRCQELNLSDLRNFMKKKRKIKERVREAERYIRICLHILVVYKKYPITFLDKDIA